MKQKLYLAVLLVFIWTLHSFAQTADFTEGCAPLTVNFTGPDQPSYFWDFKDSASSNEQNPENVFTIAGTYNVELYDVQNGTLTGTITIQVYPDIEVDISNDNDFGCIPLDVNFSATVNADPAITLDDIAWTFGDGNTGNGNSPMNTYTFGNVFDISVALTTSVEKCNITIEFPDQVEAENLISNIIVPDDIPCTEPSTFPVSADIAEDSRYSYSWNFGNGITRNGFDAGTVTYDNFGEYTISLTVSSPSGCVETSTLEVTIGPPSLVLNYPAVVCVGETFTTDNNTLVNQFDWRFGEPEMRSFDRDLVTSYNTPGVKDIRLIATASAGCVRDTTIQILVEQPNANFTLEPEIFCEEGTPLALIAEDPSLAEYIWNDQDGTNTYNYPTISGPRDPLHINVADSIVMNLKVKSENGCETDSTIRFDFRLAEAYYIPDQIRGFNSLDVTFSDFSESQNDIVRRYWIYGDGSEKELDPNTTEHTYTYDCGQHYPRLVIEDSYGCIDTSKAIEIRVICPGDPGTGSTINIPGDNDPNDDVKIEGEKILCANTTSTEYIFQQNGFNYHIYGDDNRIDHCWLAGQVVHEYKWPGVHPLTFIREYEGIVIDTIREDTVTVLGTRPEILYERNCDNRFSVDLISNSINADKYEWFHEDALISEDENHSYSFSETGQHNIILRTTNTLDGCPPNEDTVTIYIPELKADFQLPSELMCDSEAYMLDASMSEDVGASCHKGYKWIFEHQRPREVGEQTLEHQFIRGEQDITLVVEDVNGCTDTLTKKTTIYGIEPDFNLDTTACFPYERDLTDLSLSDTTLVEWQWSFGSQEQNPLYTFTEADINPDKRDTVSVELIVKDAIGCVDTVLKELRVIDPNFFVNSQGGSTVCVGEQFNINAIDTAGIKDEYQFYWDVDGARQDTGFQASLTLSDPGDHLITLIVEHNNGACTRMIDREITALSTPMPGFVSDKDTVEKICYPAQISFTSDPSLNSNDLSFLWRFGDEDESRIVNPTIEFGRGTHQVTQIVTNSEGCSDSTSMFYTLVGPSGNFVQDKAVICLGESVTYSLTDTASITNYFWNFGDGTEAENQNPVTHTYDFRPLGDSTIVTLTLESDETDCDVTEEYPIFISNVSAEIEDLGQLCRGELRLENLSTNATSYFWDFDDGTTSDEFNPDKSYETSGSYNVILIATDDTNCAARDTVNVVVDEDPGIYLGMPNLFTPNNDSRNDLFGPQFKAGAEDDVEILVFRIYNRYGELIYDNNSLDGWNGIFNGGTAPPEVYAYYIEIEISGCSTIVQKGNVTLMR